MLSVLLSMNRSCTEPVGVVWMRSLCTILAPTVRLTVVAPGGVLSVIGLTAVAVPTCCAEAGRVTAAIMASASTTVRLRLSVITCFLEFKCRPARNRKIMHCKCRDVGGVRTVLHEHAHIDLAPDRHVEAQTGAPFVGARRRVRVDRRVRRVILPMAEARDRRQR